MRKGWRRTCSNESPVLRKPFANEIEVFVGHDNGDSYEVLSGFTIEIPWTHDESCLASRAASDQASTSSLGMGTQR